MQAFEWSKLIFDEGFDLGIIRLEHLNSAQYSSWSLVSWYARDNRCYLPVYNCQ